jgi:hypothetical protein
MAIVKAVQPGLRQVIERFPEHARAARLLLLASPAFRSVCEDYALALDGLARFERLDGAGGRAEIADYRAAIAGLEAEITMLLQGPAAPR